MALFHLSVTQTKRSAGQSAIASAAYRAGERLYSEYYGEYSDYTRKGGVICSDILLPSHAPKEYADRQTLWNAVEKAERGKTAQLAYSFEISLQNEFSLEENIALARKFLLEQFVSRGMTVDVSFHEKERAETQLLQEQHKLERLENRKKYLEKGERQKRTHRLCNLGGTIESLAPEVKDLTRTEMTELMEHIFSLSEVQRAVRHMAITHTNQANREKELKADGTISSERHAD